MPSVNLRSETLSEREKRNLAILETLMRNGPITRPEISQSLGLNIVTVSNYMEDFISHNLVFEKEFDISEGGRRPILLDINPDAGFVIGVGLNLLNVVGVLVDFKGRIINRSCLERKAVNIKDIINCISETISSVLNKSQNCRDKIKGIGIGIAGLVNKKDGSLRWPEKIDNIYKYASTYVPLRDVIEKEFGFPVMIENDATAACFGEQWLNLQSDVKNLIYMFSGVGCGIMINGEVYTGADGLAGEVSIYNTKEDPSFNCKEGKPCFLKRWEIDFSMAEDARAIISDSKDKSAGKRLLELAGQDINRINLRTIFQAAKENEPLAVEILTSAARRLGIKIAFVTNLLNPEVVIIGGGLEEAGNLFLNTVKSTVKEWAFKEVVDNLKIIYSNLGENAVSLGAASLVMRQVFARA